MASSPCSDATTDERGGEEEAVTEIGGDSDSGGALPDRVRGSAKRRRRRPGARGLNEQWAHHKREKRERGGSFTGGELYQRRQKQRGWHWVELVLGRRESVCGSEREKTRVMPGLNTRREAKGKRERKMAAGGLAIDGRRLCGVKEK
jgi:hypothetical protein